MSREIADKYSGITIAGRETIVYASGGAVDLASLAEKARRAGGKVVGAGARVGRATVGGVKRVAPYVGAAAITVGKGAYGVGLGAKRAGAYVADTKLQEWRRSKGLPVGEEPYVVYTPRPGDPSSWAEPARISGQTAGPTPGYYASGQDQIVTAPYNMGCYRCLVAYAAGARVIQRGQYYHCPLCGETLSLPTR